MMILFMAGSIACVNSFGPKSIEISELKSTPLLQGDRIEFQDVQITSPITEEGMYIAGLEGGANNAIWVDFDNDAPSNVKMGDVIAINGTYHNELTTTEQGRFHTINRLSFSSGDTLNVLARDRMIPTTLYDISDLSSAALMEDLESVLIRVENVDVENQLDIWSMNAVQIGETYFSPDLKLDNASFRAIQGIFTLKSGLSTIMPRNDSDLVGMHQSCEAQRCLVDLEPGELIITEIMANPDNAGRCDDYDGEYIEVMYTPFDDSSVEVDLAGLIISDDNEDVALDKPLVAGSYEPIWLSMGHQSCYGEPNRYLGSSIRLNNGGDEISVSVQRNDGDILVFNTVKYDDSQSSKGKSIQLDSRGLSSNGQNDPRHWCEETVLIDMSQDFGSPGKPNSGCY